MPGMTISPTAQRRGKLASGAMVGLAVLLFALVCWRVQASPRTHVAYLYADTTALAPDVSGRIVRLLAHENQRVHAGEVLAEIDPEPFQLHLQQAKAQQAALEAQLSLADRQVSSQNSGADAAATNVGRARTQLKLAQDTLRRLQPMLSAGYVTPQKIDEAQANERSAAATLAAAEQQASQARLGVSDTRSLTAQLDAARANVALAERDLRHASVVAPFDGLVSGLEIAEGSYASAGHPLFTVVDTSRWYAVADFRETDLRHLAPGDAASVWLLADGRSPLAGHVESLGWGVRAEAGGAPGLPSVERSLKWVVIAQRFPVRIRIDQPPPDAMRIGATVTVVVKRHDAS